MAELMLLENDRHSRGSKTPVKTASAKSTIDYHRHSVAIALLLQNPRLAEIVEQKEIDWNELEFQGIEIFKNIHASDSG